jgi:hypothetical protein
MAGMGALRAGAPGESQSYGQTAILSFFTQIHFDQLIATAGLHTATSQQWKNIEEHFKMMVCLTLS